MRDWPRDSMKEEKLGVGLSVSTSCFSRHCRGKRCVRNAIGFLHVVEVLIQVPCAFRVLAEIVDDIAEPAHPDRAILESGQLAYV